MQLPVAKLCHTALLSDDKQRTTIELGYNEITDIQINFIF